MTAAPYCYRHREELEAQAFVDTPRAAVNDPRHGISTAPHLLLPRLRPAGRADRVDRRPGPVRRRADTMARRNERSLRRVSLRSALRAAWRSGYRYRLLNHRGRPPLFSDRFRSTRQANHPRREFLNYGWWQQLEKFELCWNIVKTCAAVSGDPRVVRCVWSGSGCHL